MTPENKKLITYGAIGVGALIAINYAIGDSEGGGTQPDPTGNGSGSSGGGTGAPVFNASAIAETLYNYMREMGTANNGTRVLNVLKYVSRDQFAQVVGKFGRRSYNKTTGNQYNFWFGSLPLEPLQVWLENELDEEVYETLRSKYPNHL